VAAPHTSEITREDAFAFVWELLKTGLLLTDTISRFLDDLDDCAFGGEENGVVLIEMAAGTVAPALAAAGPDVIRRGLIACEVAWAEVAAGFGDVGQAEQALNRTKRGHARTRRLR
jgi:hypothetical protein